MAAAIFLGCTVSPPSLMDDVDAVQAQIARNMIDSGDWVTPHLDGVAYLEKSPLKYWLIAGSFKIFGVHDWAARIPVSLAAVILCWLVCRMGAWAFSVQRRDSMRGWRWRPASGCFSSPGFRFPKSALAATIALAMWGFPAGDRSGRARSRACGPRSMAAAIGTGLLFKGLIAAVFPVAAALLYLAFTRQIVRAGNLAAAAPLEGTGDCAGDRRALARAGGDSQSSAIRFHLHSGPATASIAAFFGFTSSMSTCCGF